MMTASLSFGQAGGDLLPEGTELVDVQTAASHVVVLLIRDNETGAPPTQEVGAYAVDGRAPLRVGRHSATIYEDRADGTRFPQIVLHKMYLVLAEPLVEGRRYAITYPGGGTANFTFSAARVLCESIKVNQVGYNPRARVRQAFFAQWMGDLGGAALDEGLDFTVHDRQTGDAVFRGRVEAAREDEESGGPVSVLDLSGLTRPGAYYLVIPGVGRSYDFGLGDTYAQHSFYVHMKGFYHQRCGVALEAPYTRWTREACHTTMGITDAEPPGFIREEATHRRPSIGGHHDAGDFDHRPSHTLVPGWLMNAYELFPAKFTDGQLNIPESGNGIPDLLDEALFAIRRWEVLQEDDGGVRAGVEANRHPGYGFDTAATDALDYRTFRRDGHTTLAGAALFAWASRLVQPYDARRAGELLERAQRAWGFYRRHADDGPYVFTRGGRLYAAGQLYLATGEQEFHDIFIEESRYFCGAGPERPTWPQQYAGTYYNLNLTVQGMAFTHYFMSYLLDENPARPKDAETVERWRAALIGRADDAERLVRNNVWAQFRVGSWGMATGVGRWGDYLMNAYRLTNEQRYFDAASQAADYVLGANPVGWSFTTGLGSRPPYSPCHLDSYPYLAAGQGPVPGLVVYGFAGWSGRAYTTAVTRNVYPTPLPALRHITDGWSVISAMEFTTWETMAPNAFLHACLAPDVPMRGPQMPYGEPRLPGGYPRR